MRTRFALIIGVALIAAGAARAGQRQAAPKSAASMVVYKSST